MRLPTILAIGLLAASAEEVKEVLRLGPAQAPISAWAETPGGSLIASTGEATAAKPKGK